MIENGIANDPLTAAIVAAVPDSDAVLGGLIPLLGRDAQKAALDRLSPKGLETVLAAGVQDALPMVTDNRGNLGVILPVLDNNSFDVELRSDAIGALKRKTPTVLAALKDSNSDPCEVAMAAIDALSDVGDKSLVPKRTTGVTSDGARILCLLAYASDSVYAQEVLDLH